MNMNRELIDNVIIPIFTSNLHECVLFADQMEFVSICHIHLVARRSLSLTMLNKFPFGCFQTHVQSRQYELQEKVQKKLQSLANNNSIKHTKYNLSKYCE